VISAAEGANESLELDVVVAVVGGEVCGDGVTSGSGTEDNPMTDTPFGCELVDVGVDDEEVRLEKGVEEMTTLEDEVEVLWTEEDEEVVVVVVVADVVADVDEELELDTDAGGTPGVTAHCRTTCTRG
jgi:hypothetical protein